jgi:hypothetical protein
LERRFGRFKDTRCITDRYAEIAAELPDVIYLAAPVA